MGYSWRQRRKIEQNARAKVGLQKDQSHEDFMDDCIAGLLDDGEASDADEAEAMCEMIWDEEQ